MVKGNVSWELEETVPDKIPLESEGAEEANLDILWTDCWCELNLSVGISPPQDSGGVTDGDLSPFKDVPGVGEANCEEEPLLKESSCTRYKWDQSCKNPKSGNHVLAIQM